MFSRNKKVVQANTGKHPSMRKSSYFLSNLLQLHLQPESARGFWTLVQNKFEKEYKKVIHPLRGPRGFSTTFHPFSGRVSTTPTQDDSFVLTGNCNLRKLKLAQCANINNRYKKQINEQTLNVRSIMIKK